LPTDPQAKVLLVLSQVYVPDPASVGQHMHDAAAEMARRGFRVVVLTANRGYDDPSIRYKRREKLDGVEVRRLPLSSFGKRSIKQRLLAAVLFISQCITHGLFIRRLSGILVSTSPPMCSAAAIAIAAVRRVPIKYWVMDLNPDQLIVLERASEDALPVRAFNMLNRMILKRANDIVVLDRFMAQRLKRKRDVTEKLHILPPWPHEDHLQIIPHTQNPFRKEHGLESKFVIMYSGNHSPSSPITTVLKAALRLQDEAGLVFMFIGGGDGKKEVEDVVAEHKPANIVSLPYQPLSRIKYSLSAADVHVVVVGDAVVGVVHPCKIYGAMAVAKPILLLAPDPCHASDLVEPNGIGWRIMHGDVDGAVQTIRTIYQTDRDKIGAMGQKAKRIVHDRISKSVLLGKFADIVGQGLDP